MARLGVAATASTMGKAVLHLPPVRSTGGRAAGRFGSARDDLLQCNPFFDTCDRILGSRVMSDKLPLADNSMSDNATTVERKCLTDYRDPNECPTKQQMRNSAYEGD